MTVVVSPSNARLKAIRRLLTNGTAREQHRQTVLEGIHLCAAYLERLGTPELCLVGELAAETAEVGALLQRLPTQHVLVAQDALITPLSTLQHAIALMFVISIPAVEHPPMPDVDTILIDRLQDPGNLGSILRSAAGFGFRQIVLSSQSAAVWSPKVLRAGMGAHFGLAIHPGYDLQAFIKASRISIYATSSHADVELPDVRFDRPACAFLFGNEGQGVASQLMEQCVAIRVPQPGGEESLNVAAAAAICLFETVRQRRADI